MAIDLTTPNGRVRLLIADTDESNLAFAPAPGGAIGDASDPITAFLAMAAESYAVSQAQVYQAAGLALRTMAVNGVTVKGKTKLLDVQVDGPAEAEAYNSKAVEYEQMAASLEQNQNGFLFEVVGLEAC